MNKETIHIENLSIGYPGKGDVKVVADGICAGINSGELTCLLGANGVGKSTLLRTLSAFQPKLGGNIFIEGKEIGGLYRQAAFARHQRGADGEVRYTQYVRRRTDRSGA